MRILTITLAATIPCFLPSLLSAQPITGETETSPEIRSELVEMEKKASRIETLHMIWALREDRTDRSRNLQQIWELWRSQSRQSSLTIQMSSSKVTKTHVAPDFAVTWMSMGKGIHGSVHKFPPSEIKKSAMNRVLFSDFESLMEKFRVVRPIPVEGREALSWFEVTSTPRTDPAIASELDRGWIRFGVDSETGLTLAFEMGTKENQVYGRALLIETDGPVNDVLELPTLVREAKIIDGLTGKAWTFEEKK